MSDQDATLGEDFYDLEALGEETGEAIAKAFFDYKEKLIEIFKSISDENLLKYSGVVSSEEIANAFGARHLVPRMVAQNEVNMRYMYAKAKIVMDTGARSYCVEHDMDGSICPCKDLYD